MFVVLWLVGLFPHKRPKEGKKEINMDIGRVPDHLLKHVDALLQQSALPRFRLKISDELHEESLQHVALHNTEVLSC